MKKTVVITGVSTGFGYAAAKELIARGYHVFGSVRKESDGQRVQTELGQSFTPLLFDVTDHQALPAAVEQVRAFVGDNGIAGLINNAGVAHTGPLMHLPLSEFRQVFEINVVGVLAVTQAFLPLLGGRRNCPHAPGRIINMSSISGGTTFPMLATYAVSKHALEALTDGMRRELNLYGIKVSAIEPGSIKTPIWDKSPKSAQDHRYDGTDYAQAMQNLVGVVDRELEKAKPISVVINAIVDALEASSPKTRYPLVGLWHLRKVLPDRVLDGIMLKTIGGLERLQ
ncbi:SDR family oxidoreductase [Pseudomonas sp. N040]|uniref:SDR family oxidoreductase n=1 Tax=Pseudomonas sp. N040 TaxID=2785325 RepID=UPI0018A3293A|nr:SDR family oxidoreductase [Pseudomonas sp. N040]MBF7730664.1 SDR family oxidoreductase [Pseudomonas sp. N040]MBW7014307.1 SDR family oxidoreductase [Pseudomonas sp. N040]